jgi:hypothetical protein
MTNERYFYSVQDVTLVTNQEDYDLPTDFWILLGVDLLPSGSTTAGTRITLFEQSWADRNKFKNYTFSLYGRMYQWMLIGDKFRISPLPGNIGDAVRLHYVPDITTLVSDTDRVITEPQFDEFISTYAAKIMMDKQEDDTTAITNRLAVLEQDIRNFAQARQTCNSRPVSIVEDNYNSQLINPYGGNYSGGGGYY